jgi:hypothetical protein
VERRRQANTPGDGMSNDPQQAQAQQHLIESTEAMLDYAIIAGAELKNPLFVRLLRLARGALLGAEQPHLPGRTTAHRPRLGADHDLS